MFKTVTKIIVVNIICIIVFNYCGGRKVNQGVPAFTPSAEQLTSFENQLDRLSRQLKLSGLSAVLVNNREIVWQKSWDTGSNAATTVTPYPIGTLTNIFVPVIVLQLMEEEKLDLNDPVMKYIDTYNGKASNKHLLTHTSEGTPASTFRYNQREFSRIADVIEKASGNDLTDLVSDKIIDKLNMQQTSFGPSGNSTEGLNSSLNDLAIFSRAIDDTIFLENKDLAKYLFRPMYLVTGERTPCSIGWFVEYYRNIKFCWNFGCGNNYSSLLIKEPNRQLTLILLSKSEQMNQLFDLQTGNCLNSPFALSFLKTFFFSGDSLPFIDYQAGYDSIKAKLTATKSTDDRDLYVRELLSYIKMFESLGKSEIGSKLIKLYNDVYPNEIDYKYVKETPLAEINGVHDSYIIQREFSLNEKTNVRIFAVGEKQSGITYNDPWQDDNVEIYFDMKDEKNPGFDTGGDDHQYRVQWNRTEITGSNIPTDGVIVKQQDYSGTAYRVEFQFPWKTLGFVTPKSGLTIGFDVIIGDNDGTSQRKGCIGWHTDQNNAYNNTSVYGHLRLKNGGGGSVSDSIVYAAQTTRKPVIDGNPEGMWNSASRYPFSKAIEGNIADENDCSASFRALWDDTNLYLLIDVTDNKKYSRPGVMQSDYGWIERKAEKDTVWMMTDEKEMPAGGDPRNVRVEKQLQLDPGEYLLRYISNGTHSYDHWIADRPETSLYGIIVYKEDM